MVLIALLPGCFVHALHRELVQHPQPCLDALLPLTHLLHLVTGDLLPHERDGDRQRHEGQHDRQQDDQGDHPSLRGHDETISTDASACMSPMACRRLVAKGTICASCISVWETMATPCMAWDAIACIASSLADSIAARPA